MKYSKNYQMNLPDLSDQFNLKHLNGNTEKVDTELKNNADAITKVENDFKNGTSTSNKAERDASGNVITSTYATKTEVKDKVIDASHGGSGKTSLNASANAYIKNLNTGTDSITDNAVFITSSNSLDDGVYYRRSAEGIWNWIKSKISTVLGLTATQYDGKSNQADGLYEANYGSWKPSYGGNGVNNPSWLCSWNETNKTIEACATSSLKVAEAKNCTRKVNNHTLTSDVTVTKDDVGLGNVSNKTDNQLKQMTFDVMFPVGKVLPQLPGEDSPQTMYNKNGIISTWTPLTSIRIGNEDIPLNNKFFKINNDVISGTPTAESLPNIKGEILTNSSYSLFWGGDTTKGAFQNFTTEGYYANAGGLSTTAPKGVLFDASKTSSGNGKTYKDGAKVQPDNVSIALWKRTK